MAFRRRVEFATISVPSGIVTSKLGGQNVKLILGTLGLLAIISLSTLIHAQCPPQYSLPYSRSVPQVGRFQIVGKWYLDTATGHVDLVQRQYDAQHPPKSREDENR
jgi:hypothetical protein